MAKTSEKDTQEVSRPGSVSNGSSAWLRLQSRINHALDNFYYRLGYWVAGHTKATLATSLILVILCCMGFTSLTTTTDADDVWVPSDSLSKQHEDIVQSYFDDESDHAVLLFESPSGSGGSVLTKDAFDKLWDIHAEVLALETAEGNSYADLCTKELDGVTCDQPFRSVMRFWGSNFTTYETEVADDLDLLDSINVDVYPDGQAVNLEALFGDTITYNANREVVGAAATSQSYLVEPADEGEVEDESMAWQKEFIDLLGDEANSYSDTFNIVYRADRSIDDALGESLSGEIPIAIVTYAMMIAFVMVVIGRCGTGGSIRRRSWLGLAGVMLVVAATIAAFGINSAFGVPFTDLTTILPFILVGIGVDDMFVIVASFDQTDSSLEVEDRVALALKRCGISITYTSLTNFFAFMLGSLSLIPAVEYFCLYAGTAIMFDFILQMTAVVAFVTMDARRQEAGKMDWCCCCTNPRFLEQEHMQRGVDMVEHETSDAPAKNIGPAANELNSVGRWLRDRHSPLILSVPGKILVLLATAGLLAAGIYGVTQVTEGFDIVDLAPDDHYIRDYVEKARDYDLEVNSKYVPLNIYTRNVDYRDVGVQVQIQATDALIEDQRFVVGPIDSWLTSFIAWANTTGYSDSVGKVGDYRVFTDGDTFFEALANFTQDGENSRFLSDIVYSDDKTIEISRTEVYFVDLTTTYNNIDALEDARDVVEASPLDPGPFSFSPVFIVTELYLVIYEELVSSFALALVAVAILSALVLGQLLIVLLVCVAVVAVDVNLLGFVYHWGLELNSITVIELIMAVGLVVDYMVHIVHYFLHQDAKVGKDKRIADALGEIGPSVILGATTTFLGIISMAFASSFIFRVFFRMFLIIIAFGFFHGVVFVPVALSLIPDKLLVVSRPAAVPDSVAEEVKQDEGEIVGLEVK